MRGERVCTFCSRQVDDEVHILECPMYFDLRRRYRVDTWTADVQNWTDEAAKLTFNRKDEKEWNKLAEFLFQCRRMRIDGW